MLLLTLRGTATVYYGDELGMCDVPIPPERVHDPWERNVPGLGLGRDPERTPMQWSAAPHAGFSTVTPWLPVAENFAQCNVAAQQQDPRSMLHLYRRLLQLRAAEPAFKLGAYTSRFSSDQLLVYQREHATQRLLVALNFSAQAATFAEAGLHGETLLSTNQDRDGATVQDAISLEANEGVIVRLNAPESTP
jgi:alpha-glucosidase